jgi:hypothetical protein
LNEEKPFFGDGLAEEDFKGKLVELYEAGV